MDAATQAMRERLLAYDAQYVGFPVPVPTLGLQIQHIDGCNDHPTWMQVADRLEAEDPAVVSRSTRYHVLAPTGNPVRQLCLQHRPSPPQYFYEEVLRMLVYDFGRKAPLYEFAQRLEQERKDYPFPGLYDWLPERMREYFGTNYFEGYLIQN